MSAAASCIKNGKILWEKENSGNGWAEDDSTTITTTPGAASSVTGKKTLVEKRDTHIPENEKVNVCVYNKLSQYFFSSLTPTLPVFTVSSLDFYFFLQLSSCGYLVSLTPRCANGTFVYIIIFCT